MNRISVAVRPTEMRDGGCDGDRAKRMNPGTLPDAAVWPHYSPSLSAVAPLQCYRRQHTEQRATRVTDLPSSIFYTFAVRTIFCSTTQVRPMIVRHYRLAVRSPLLLAYEEGVSALLVKRSWHVLDPDRLKRLIIRTDAEGHYTRKGVLMTS